MTMRALRPSSSIHASRVPAGLMSMSIRAGRLAKASTGGGATAQTGTSQMSHAQTAAAAIALVFMTVPRASQAVFNRV
jgi:hypothetical protein